MSMFNDISWEFKDNEQECNAHADLVSIYAKRFSPRRWSFFGPGSEKSGSLLMKADHKENGMGFRATTNRSASQMLISSLSRQRDLEQDNGHSWDLDQRKVVFYQ